MGGDRLSIFVPAVMSVGLLFWLLSQLRDVAHSRRRRNRIKQARLAARTIAAELTAADADPVPPPGELGLHERVVYLLGGAVLWATAVYVAVGSVANYVRPGGYVADIAWLLALSLAVALGSAVLGTASLSIATRYPRVPGPAVRLFRSSALSVDPTEPTGGRPSWRVTAVTAVLWAGFAVLTMLIGWSPHRIARIDERVADWAQAHRLPGPATWLDLAGSTSVGIAVTAVGLALAYRCRVLFLSGLGAVVAGQLAGRVVRSLVSRPRPATGAFPGRLDSFPSGHLVLLTLLAGLLPLVVASLVRRPWVIAPLRAVLGAVVLASGYHRVAQGQHWPLDILGSLLFAAALMATVERGLRFDHWHEHCRPSCPWRAAAAPATGEATARALGAIPLGLDAATAVRAAAHASAGLAAIGLTVLSFTRGVPTNPEGSGLGTALERPVQLGLAVLVSIAALIGWRRPAVGALLLAVAATGLGVFAGVEYRPGSAVLLTGALLVPAVLLWLSWQHHRRPVEIVLVGAVAVALVTGTWVGAATVYDSYFGPTHPTSLTRGIALDRVEWFWAGALDSRSISVTARLAEGHRQAVLVATSERDGSAVRSEAQPAGDERIVTLRVRGLAPDTAYRTTIEVDGVADAGRGVGRFRTPGEGRYSFRVAVASCARTGSNGAVYDAIAAAEPLLFLELGDLHYENLTATVAKPFIDAIGYALSRPAQAALFRSVPVGYVWDDHDYGPNDAGAASPTRDAMRAAYRTAVPHYELRSGDGAINQAFTIGRVRFVITDGRSERTAGSLLGDEQRRWLIDELTAAGRTHALVVWANATPWIGAAREGADTWAGFGEERAEIGQALADAGIDNLVMVSGDAHMVAIDDGTNSGYAAGGEGGFPVLQAAALDRPGSVKGGPYSEGTFPGGGQFGLVDIDDLGDRIVVTMRGMRWDGAELVTLERRFDVD
ncbi:MAG: alkaline phosphatase D family protein [Acidimicrobiales bacterium]|nr:alkaline phosphatase D family protein [Acidimicrobiales bacterium]